MSTDKSPTAAAMLSGADSHKSIIKSTSVIALGTLLSRVLGFFRDIILAKLLGTGIIADAFFVAQKIPNLFRDLVGEGATNAAVVPVFSEYLEKKSRKEFWQFVSVIFVLGLIILTTITVIGIFLSPLIIRMMAPGFISNPRQLELAISLTKLLFPYLIFIGLTAYSMGILYTFRSFTSPAFSPCLLNIAVIVSAVVSFKTMKEPVYGLAIGVLIGGVLQLAMQIRPMLKFGMVYEHPKTLRHPGALKIGKLLIPRILGGGVYQLSVFIDTFCASLSSIVGAGGISAIYYANRIIQFPMGIFSVALASAVLPTLSGLVQKNDIGSLKKTVVFSLENIFFVMCPTTVILLILSVPIIRILFERGEFNFYSTQITSSSLAFFAIGLFSFGGIKILVTAFHALQDTKTPVIVAFTCLVINTALNFVLMFPLKVSGIALASAIAGTIDFLALFYILDKRLGGFDSDLLGYFSKVTIASGLIGIVEYFGWNYVPISSDVLKLCVVGMGGFVIYEIICLALGVLQARKVWSWIKAGFVIESS